MRTAGGEGMTTFDLFSAVRDGNTEIVRRLLQTRQCRARLNDRNEWGDTALHLAAETGSTEICHMLRAAGASVMVRNNRGETCLHRAAVSGHVEACRAIVGQGNDPESVNSQNDAGYTALHHAARHGSKELIEILLKGNADRLIENNAGETAYMVAQRSQQFEAEHLLLNMEEQQHADRAISEMNRKEKDIIRAYLRAVNHASHLESRVRITLVGDNGTGKSCLKSTIYGDHFNPNQSPTSGIDADPSITRIKFKQYREWIQQLASKADARRLNLEYIDIVIDYILSSLEQPRVSDDSFNISELQIEKERVMRVGFCPADVIIPENPVFEVSGDTSYRDIPREIGDVEEEEEEEGEVEEDEEGEGEVEEGEEREEVPVDAMEFPDVVSSVDSGSVYILVNDEAERAKEREVKDASNDKWGINPTRGILQPSMHSLEHHDSSSSGSMCPATSTSTPSSSSGAVESSEDEVRSKPVLQGSTAVRVVPPQTGSMRSQTRVKLESNSGNFSHPPPAPSSSKRLSAGLHNDFHHRGLAHKAAPPMYRTRAELSRLLLENIPREILKRMVIRWPVGGKRGVSRAELNKERLAISTWDVSGDPLQQNFTPFFFSHRCLFVVMYNLARGLDSPCENYANKNLRDLNDHIPTNAEVFEGWLGSVTAFSKSTPSVPFRCTESTPVLPPIILACSFVDREEVRMNPIVFHQFFNRESFASYRKHLVDSKAPSAVLISNVYENDGEEGYSGHHLLRREIDHLARQMPYCGDSIPIQWVKFEQLIYGLQEQKKVILLYDHLTQYISEHCNMSGMLQILPVLSHFHDIGIISYFYRHPMLSNIVITKPQWLLDALSSVITSNPSKWITTEAQASFARLSREGVISKEYLLMAYRCGRMHQRYWNETLFILSCMDLACCHPSLHEASSFYVPCLVTHSVPRTMAPIHREDESPVLHFSSGTSILPVAVYNQLVVRIIRGSQFVPKIFYSATHIRLNASFHLVLSKHSTSIAMKVEKDHEHHCRPCLEMTTEPHAFSPRCGHIQHVIGERAEFTSDNIPALIKLANRLSGTHEPYLAFPDSTNSLDELCPSVLNVVQHHLRFLTDCWFPGLKLDLLAFIKGVPVVLDQYWHHTVRAADKAPASVCVWFK